MAKAVRFHSFGDSSVLRYEDIPELMPKAGEAVVRIDAAGVNSARATSFPGLKRGRSACAWSSSSRSPTPARRTARSKAERRRARSC